MMVILVNGEEVKVEGIESVKLKLGDGVVNSFINVRYIFKLEMNLILFGSFDE